MTDFLRRFSQVSRVRAGFGFLALAVWAIGFTAAGALNSHAPEVALAIGAAAGIVGTGLIGGWLVSVSIKAPVDDTAQAVMRIAAGDLETKIESPGRDELSWLRHELNTMRKKLRSAVVTVNQSVRGVAAASQEIAKGNGDLSSRTENQAAALQQTASSIWPAGRCGAQQRRPRPRRQHRDLTSARRGRARGRHDARRGCANGRHPDQCTPHLRDHRRHRRNRVPDQHPGAKRGGRSARAGERRHAASRWSPTRSAVLPSVAQTLRAK